MGVIIPFASAVSCLALCPSSKWGRGGGLKNVENWRGENWQGKPEILGEKSAPQISHGLPWDWTKVYMQKRILTNLLSTLVVLSFQTLVKSPSSNNLVISKLDLSTCVKQSRKFKTLKWRVLVICVVWRQGIRVVHNIQINRIILSRIYTQL
jgi:hypothetical protein